MRDDEMSETNKSHWNRKRPNERGLVTLYHIQKLKNEVQFSLVVDNIQQPVRKV